MDKYIKNNDDRNQSIQKANSKTQPQPVTGSKKSIVGKDSKNQTSTNCAPDSKNKSGCGMKAKITGTGYAGPPKPKADCGVIGKKIAGLNSAGFGKKDCGIDKDIPLKKQNSTPASGLDGSNKNIGGSKDITKKSNINDNGSNNVRTNKRASTDSKKPIIHAKSSGSNKDIVANKNEAVKKPSGFLKGPKEEKVVSIKYEESLGLKEEIMQEKKLAAIPQEKFIEETEDDLFSDIKNFCNEFDDKIGVEQKDGEKPLTNKEAIDLEKDLHEGETIFTEEMLLISDTNQSDLKVSDLTKNKSKSDYAPLSDIMTTESVIEEKKTKQNNFIGKDKAKTIYQTIKDQIENESIDEFLEKNLNSKELDDEIKELTNIIICEKIVEESNKKHLTKSHLIQKDFGNKL